MNEYLSDSTDIIFLQEHWLFDCKLHKPNEICGNRYGKGKAVDTGDPILPLQMPHGYGGMVILWRKDIYNLIQVYPSRGN